MSLLIKALDKAQTEKAQAKVSADKKQTDQSKNRTQPPIKETQTTDKPVNTTDELALSLSPPEENLTSVVENRSSSDEVPRALRGSAADLSQKAVLHAAEVKPAFSISKPSNKPFMSASAEEPVPPSQAQAANVFAVKRIEPTYQTAKIAILVGLVALVIMAALIYWYQYVFNAPEIVIPPRPVISQEMPEPLPELPVVNEEIALTVDPEASENTTEGVADADSAIAVDKATDKVDQQAKRSKSIMAPNNLAPAVEKTLVANEVVVDKTESIAFSNNAPQDMAVASESASIEVTQTKTASGVNPILMRAYEAYNAGNDNQAQQDYKQVLQRYGLNVDALLGLGAIATRQGRLADANGWYQKVLELEPRNEVAKAGLISLQQNNQTLSSESNIKSMLATTPDDANLHAALGDVYASQGRWSSAQQAYFDAYRINRSAENAFNLGVSLDQLGKSNLALPYYQEALQKAGQTSVIDTVALEARISSIQ